MFHRTTSRLALLVFVAGFSAAAQAAPFTVTNGNTETTAQTLGASESGTVNSGGALDVTTADGADGGMFAASGTDGTAVSTSSAGVTITNDGTMQLATGMGGDGSGGNDYGGDGGNAFLIHFTNGSGTVTNNDTMLVNSGDGGAGDGYGGYGGDVGLIYASALSGTLFITNDGTMNANGGDGGDSPDYGGGGFDVYGIRIGNVAHTVTIENTGTIQAFGGAGGAGSGGLGYGGGGAHTLGIRIASDNASLTNEGFIRAYGGNGGVGDNFGGNGGDAAALYIDGDNNTITNSGTITAVGGGGGASGGFGGDDGFSRAIWLIGNDNTLTLNDGSDINGEIRISGDDNILVLGQGYESGDTVVFAGNGSILRYTTGASYPKEGGGFGVSAGAAPDLSHFSGTYTEEVTVLGSAPTRGVVVTSGQNSLVITPDAFALADQSVLNDTSVQAQQLVENRQQVAMLGGQNSGVAAGSPGLLSRAIAWAEGFGSWRERPKDRDAVASTTQSGGVLAGLDLPENGAGYTTGVYAGGFAGSNELGATTFRTINSRGILAGGYAGRTIGNTYVALMAQAGYATQRSSRTVGSDIAHADYGSWFVTPSVTAMHKIPTAAGVLVVPSLTLRYTAQFTDGYTESGSAANQRVGSRTYGRAGARAMVDIYPGTYSVDGGKLKPTFRLGLDGDTTVGKDDVDLTVLGTNVALDPKTGATLDGIAGLNVALDLDGGPTLYADGEAAIGLNKGGASHNMGVTGRLGARWAF